MKTLSKPVYFILIIIIIIIVIIIMVIVVELLFFFVLFLSHMLHDCHIYHALLFVCLFVCLFASRLRHLFSICRSLSAFSAYSCRPSGGPALPPLINSMGALQPPHQRHTFSTFDRVLSGGRAFFRSLSQVRIT